MTASIINAASRRIQRDVRNVLQTFPLDASERELISTLLGDGLYQLGYHRHDVDHVEHPWHPSMPLPYESQQPLDGLEPA